MSYMRQSGLKEDLVGISYHKLDGLISQLNLDFNELISLTQDDRQRRRGQKSSVLSH